MNSSAQMIFDMSDVESKENIPQKKLISKYDFSQVFEGQINNEYHNNNSMVILGDSLDVLKKMKSKTVQLIFADAPYNIGKNFGNNLDKWKNVNDYVEWCKRWLDECFRILSDDGTIYFMTATQHMPFLDVYISEKYNVLCGHMIVQECSQRKYLVHCMNRYLWRIKVKNQSTHLIKMIF